MWATQGLAVALALSVLPGSRALRPGDCEAVLAAALNPTKPLTAEVKRAGAGATTEEVPTPALG
ncbi:hypothetical protein P7K49_030489 [Saguinus oedipus]|uniref:Uncharacterized protein n=1 Tax=Saguinus oedipus TaxID=9490 RepID=A0ABQ9U2B4_SAGOE|nr:hypothetical protein P7K49_030489 [Saguinus oedipus]